MRASLPQLRRVGVPAAWALRTYRWTAALLAAAAGAGLVAALPVTGLAGAGPSGLAARISAPPVRAVDLGLGRGGLAAGPAEVRAAAVAHLFQLLVVVTAGVLCVAALSLLAIAFARSRERQLEFSVRRAVGASRRLIIAAALLEAGVLAAAALGWGGGSGVALAHAARRAWTGSVGPGSPVPTLLLAAGMIGLVLVGVLLPVGSTRRRSLVTPRSGRALELVVPALQLGLSLTVLAAAALLSRHATSVTGRVPSRAGPGELYQITTEAGREAPAVRAGEYASLLRRLSGRPDLKAASLTSPGVTIGLGQDDGVLTDCGRCAWDGIMVRFHPVYAATHLVSADTFRTLGLRVTTGRSIGSGDAWNADPVAVVSQSLAEDHFENQQAVGRKIQVGHAPARWYTVVGVVADQLPAGFGGGLQPGYAVYLSVLQHPISAVDLLVRGRGGAAFREGVERDVRAVLAPARPHIARVSEARVLDAEAAPIRWFGRLFGLEGWVMLAVATIGTFVVLRLWVTSLLHELGVRRAVGARRRHLYWLIGSRAAGIALGGVAIGCWCGGLLWGGLTSTIAGLPAWDAGIAARFGALLALAALLGAAFPAWRATRTAPAELLGQI
jgi:putative ABC transport system permease protein